MITKSEEYKQFLHRIGTETPSYKLRIPIDEPIYLIDLNTRVITPPSFLSVETDHDAEIIYFKIDRFFENIDMSRTVCLVMIKNAKNEEYAYAIPYYDITTEPGKIIFGWNIQGAVTKYSGKILFAFKFFILEDIVKDNQVQKELTFELNTLVATSKVLKGWGSISSNNTGEEMFNLLKTQILIDNDTLAAIQNLTDDTKKLESLQLFWQEA